MNKLMDKETLKQVDQVNQEAPMEDPSLPELLGQLAKSSAAMVHDQIELIIQRFREKARAIRNGIIYLAIGGVFSFVAFLSLCAALIIGLSSYMSPGIAALLTGVILILIGIAFIFIGYHKLKKSTNQK